MYMYGITCAIRCVHFLFIIICVIRGNTLMCYDQNNFSTITLLNQCYWMVLNIMIYYFSGRSKASLETQCCATHLYRSRSSCLSFKTYTWISRQSFKATKGGTTEEWSKTGTMVRCWSYSIICCNERIYSWTFMWNISRDNCFTTQEQCAPVLLTWSWRPWHCSQYLNDYANTSWYDCTCIH